MPRTSSSSSYSSRPSYSSSYSRPTYSSTNIRPSYSSRSTSPTKSTTLNNQVTKPVTQPTVVEHKVEQPGFFSNVMQGFAWGTGTSIARNIFESKPTPVIQQVPISTTNESKYENNVDECAQYKLCKKLDDPYECYNKMNQKEYEKCREKID